MRVLIAYDGSAGAAQAVALAEGIDWPAGSMLRVVSVMEPTAIHLLPWSPGIADTEGLEEDVRSSIEADWTS